MTPRLQQAIGLLQRSNQEALSYLLQEAETNPFLEVEMSAEAQDAEPDNSRDDAPEPPEVEAREDGAEELDASPPEDPAIATDDADAWLENAPLDTLVHDEDPDLGREDQDGSFEVAAVPTLHERLEEQLRLAALSAEDKLIGAYLLTMLDAVGRLSATLDEIATALGVTLSCIEQVRAVMMQFDPIGCFARDLSECLGAQLLAKNRFDPAMRTLLAHLELIGSGELPRLRRLCGVDEEDFADMLRELRALNPKPGFDPEATVRSAIPDVIVVRRGGAFVVELNEITLPRMRIDRGLGARLVGGDAATKAYGRERLAHASWLVKAMAQRSQSILMVAREIVRRQEGFLEHGIVALRPMTLRQIAESTGLHESTVSRVTATRYIETPRGVHGLKMFFSTALGAEGDVGGHSAEAIRHRIRALIAGETAAAILSDDAITAALQSEGIEIMRRTVAKYREGLNLPNSAQRRRLKKSGVR